MNCTELCSGSHGIYKYGDIVSMKHRKRTSYYDLTLNPNFFLDNPP